MQQTWQLQEAKNHFSEVVDLALAKGPQIVTRHGKQVAVVLSFKEYVKQQKPRQNLVDFFRQSPLGKHKLDLSRSDDLGRELDL